MEFDRSSHSLGESNYHFQFTPKYRRDVFRDVIIKKACEEFSTSETPYFRMANLKK